MILGSLKMNLKRIWPLKALLIVLVLISPVGLSFPPDGENVASATTGSSSSTIFLPITLHGYPRPVTVFGTQVSPARLDKVKELLRGSDTYYVRVTAFNWNDIEPNRTNPPTYNWDAVKEFELASAGLNEMRIIGTIRFTPDWAWKIPGYACGPISPESLDEFAQFLQALVQRYSYPPYNIKYWELGNEPDIDPTLLTDPGSEFGCWGDENDEFYGGGYYAEMLKVAYPAIKAVDPTAQVLIGGLLLDCDPTNPPAGKDCKPAKFLEGILRNGGGSFFDIASFHGYPTYSSASPGGELYYDEHFPGWEPRGGVVLGKLDFVREVMANNGVAKPVMHTEGSLICPASNGVDCNPPNETFFQAQADYVVWLYVRNWAAGVKGTIWYQFDGPGWRFGSLLDENQNPKPAYYALDFLTQELKGAAYIAPVTQFAPLRGYEFKTAAKKIWVLWSPDASQYTITLPGGVTGVFDKYGAEITPAGTDINIKSPIYIEFAP
jgi:hypothetical protein